jgi:hypothetical protein
VVFVLSNLLERDSFTETFTAAPTVAHDSFFWRVRVIIAKAVSPCAFPPRRILQNRIRAARRLAERRLRPDLKLAVGALLTAERSLAPLA